jgi:hypothetical protein
MHFYIDNTNYSLEILPKKSKLGQEFWNHHLKWVLQESLKWCDQAIPRSQNHSKSLQKLDQTKLKKSPKKSDKLLKKNKTRDLKGRQETKEVKSTQISYEIINHEFTYIWD